MDLRPDDNEGSNKKFKLQKKINIYEAKTIESNCLYRENRLFADIM